MKIQLIAQKDNTLIAEILSQQPQLNFNIIKTALRKKDVKINQKRQKSDVFVTKNDKIEIFLPEKKQKIIDVVYQDDNILIAFKPAGIEVATKDKTFTFTQTLQEILNVTPCHRLDKNTEGLVVCAKNNLAYNQLLQAFKQGNITKKYLAVVTGDVKQGTQKLCAYLVKHGDKNYVEVFDSKVENSVKILTNYTLLNTFEDCYLIEVELLTGKTHQIRAHLAHNKIYVVGDDKYGNKQYNKLVKVNKQQLCAYKLTFNFESTSMLNYLNGKTFMVEPTFKITTKTL